MTRIMLGLAFAGCMVALPNAGSAQQTDPQPTCKMCPGTYVPVSEIEAYELIRQQATQKRLTMAEIAVSIINAQEMLGGLGILDTTLPR